MLIVPCVAHFCIWNAWHQWLRFFHHFEYSEESVIPGMGLPVVAPACVNARHCYAVKGCNSETSPAQAAGGCFHVAMKEEL